MYLDHAKISATHSETEPDRLERLYRVYGYAIAMADVDGNTECIVKLAKLHDHKGTLMAPCHFHRLGDGQPQRQTARCFVRKRGLVELGRIDSVWHDPDLFQKIQTSGTGGSQNKALWCSQFSASDELKGCKS